MSKENAEIVKRVERIFAAYNRRDWDGFFADIYSESDFEWAPMEENVSYRGREAVLGYVESWFEAWDEFRVEIEDIEIAPAADRVWVALRYRGKGKGSEIPVEGLFFQVSELRDGKPLRAKEYTDRAEALEAAALEE
jgi:ketosteroid isomerase-like protein